MALASALTEKSLAKFRLHLSLARSSQVKSLQLEAGALLAELHCHASLDEGCF